MTDSLIIACALVHRSHNGQIQAFVAQRADSKPFLPGAYELPGGHVAVGETVEAGLQREFQEEFSLSINVGDPFAVFNYVDVSGGQATEIVYYATLRDPGAAITLLPEEHSHFRWVGLADIPGLATTTKPADDPAFAILRQGLEILSGAQPNFG